MRITYLHQYFTTPQGSGGTRSYEMGIRLVKAGHEVNIITSRYDQAALWPKWSVKQVDGIIVNSVEVPYSNSMSYPRRMLAFFIFALFATVRAARTPADVIFATSTPLTIAIPGRIAAMVRRVPFVFEVRDLWPTVPIALGALKGRFSKSLAHALERWAYAGAARIVTIAPGMKRHIESVGYPGDRVAVIPSGCDPRGFKLHSAAFDVRSQHEWLGDRRLIVYAGTIGFVDGVDWLVKVAAQTLLIDPEIRFVVAGTGRQYEDVRRHAIDLGVLERNLFMLGQVPKRTADAWVTSADAAISLLMDREYIWEHAAKNKFFDALSAGRPVLSNHPGYQTEVVVEASAGKMLDQHNHKAAARQLVDLLHDDDWLQCAAAASARLAQTQFDRDQLARKLEGVLDAAIRDGGSGSRQLEKA